MVLRALLPLADVLIYVGVLPFYFTGFAAFSFIPTPAVLLHSRPCSAFRMQVYSRYLAFAHLRVSSCLPLAPPPTPWC